MKRFGMLLLGLALMASVAIAPTAAADDSDDRDCGEDDCLVATQLHREHGGAGVSCVIGAGTSGAYAGCSFGIGGP